MESHNGNHAGQGSEKERERKSEGPELDRLRLPADVAGVDETTNKKFNM